MSTACVVAFGACTPVGRSAWASAAAVRAGISGFAEHPFMVDSISEPMRMAVVPGFEIELGGIARFEALLFAALDEALAVVARPVDQPLRIGLALALPALRPGVPDGLSGQIDEAISARYRGVFSTTMHFPQGHAGGLQALDAALDTLARGRADACLVAGIDSYADPDALEWLEANEQLHGAGPSNNAWGFIPGEAGAALLLVDEGVANDRGLPVLAHVLGVGIANELNRIKTPTVCVGRGLTEALQAALRRVPTGSRVSDIYCDMNGEPYRADEYGFASVRTAAAFVDTGEFLTPADCWGDVGAATGPLLIGLAAVAGCKRYSRGPLALVWASSEGGERAAALLRVGPLD